jgi:phosphoribosyl-dephospho-CoA transferase
MLESAAICLARHDFVRVDAAPWQAMLSARSDLIGEPLLVAWALQNRPLIARRDDRSGSRACDSSQVPLGLPLPPAQGKRRIAILLPAGAIRDITSPPRLAEIAPSAPPAWRPTIDRLLRLDDCVRAYGSLAWQHLTGLPYLSNTSDLDLLWDHADAPSSETLLAGILAIERRAPMRIDGELVAADGKAVHWRELASGSPEVMAKRLDSIALLSRQAFLSAGSTA